MSIRTWRMLSSSPRPSGSSNSKASAAEETTPVLDPAALEKRERYFAQARAYTADVRSRVTNWLSSIDSPSPKTRSFSKTLKSLCKKAVRADRASTPGGTVIKSEPLSSEPALDEVFPQEQSSHTSSLGPPSIVVNFDPTGRFIEPIFSREPRSRPVTPTRDDRRSSFLSNPDTQMARKRKSRDYDEPAPRASKRGKVDMPDVQFFQYLKTPRKVSTFIAVAVSTDASDDDGNSSRLPGKRKRSAAADDDDDDNDDYVFDTIENTQSDSKSDDGNSPRLSRKRKRSAAADDDDEYVFDTIENTQSNSKPEVSPSLQSPGTDLFGAKPSPGNRSRAPSPSTDGSNVNPRKRVKLTSRESHSTPSVSSGSSRSSSPETPTRQGRKRSESPDYAPSSTASEDEDEVNVPKQEREDLLYILTREKALRLTAAFKVPDKLSLGGGEQNLYLGLALRGCKPVMDEHWRRDFTTLPESLFTLEEDIAEGTYDPLLKAQGRSDFSAIRAFKDLLHVGANVRDCQHLTMEPQTAIQKAVQRYLRWAIDDQGLKSSPETIPVHAVHVQKPDEATLASITQLTKKLERLARRFQDALSGSSDPWWPTLVGFNLCGPVMTLVSLDTDPECSAWAEDVETPVKIIGHFDLAERDEDVWNALAIAISVIHTRDTMARLASVYAGSHVPHFLGDGERDGDEDA